MSNLSIKNLLSKDTSLALQEALDNLELLYMAGYFGTCIQTSKYLLDTELWQVPHSGEQYRRLNKLNKLFHFALKHPLDAFENQPPYSLEELQKWAKGETDKTLRSLVLIQSPLDKQFGKNWNSDFLEKLPLEKEISQGSWEHSYSYLFSEIMAILKSRLKNRLQIEDTLSHMLSSMTNSLISALGKEGFEKEFNKENNSLMEEMGDNPLIGQLFGGVHSPADSQPKESSYATQMSIKELEELFLRVHQEATPAPLDKECIDTLFVVHYLLDEEYEKALEYYEKAIKQLYKPTLDSLFEWEVFIDFFKTQKLGCLYNITKKDAQGYFGTIQRRESDGSQIDGEFDPSHFDWRQAIDDYSNKDIPKDYQIDYNPEYFERPSQGLTLISKSGKLTASEGVTDKEIDEVQKRLNVTLPPSYINYLKVSNGLLLPTYFFDLLPIEDIDFFETLEPEWVEIWTDNEDDMEDEKYNIYGIDQDPVWIRNSYLKDALQISNTLEGEVLLLNPKIKFGEEWEAWHFGNHIPGAYRYRSFAEMMDVLFSREVEK